MNKKFLVIGNPVEHSLSPKLHKYWIKKNNLKASYDKKLMEQDEIRQLILDVKREKIHGLNVTVPFKKTVIPFLDVLSDEAKNSQSVNTIYKDKDKIILDIGNEDPGIAGVYDMPGVYDFDLNPMSGYKKGGRLKKAGKRKRAALRGQRSELRGS